MFFLQPSQFKHWLMRGPTTAELERVCRTLSGMHWSVSLSYGDGRPSQVRWHDCGFDRRSLCPLPEPTTNFAYTRPEDRHWLAGTGQYRCRTRTVGRVRCDGTPADLIVADFARCRSQPPTSSIRVPRIKTIRYPATEGGTVKSSLDNFALRASDRQARSPERVHRTRTPVLSAGALARRPTANSRRDNDRFWCRDLWHEGVRGAPPFCTRPIDDPKIFPTATFWGWLSQPAWISSKVITSVLRKPGGEAFPPPMPTLG